MSIQGARRTVVIRDDERSDPVEIKLVESGPLWGEAMRVGRSTPSRKQTKVTNASAMLPMKHCATKRQRFDFQWLLVCICQMGR